MNILLIATVIFIFYWFYWIVSMMRRSQQPILRKPYNEISQIQEYEFAPEVSVHHADENYLAHNSINISGQDAANLKANWGLEQDKLDEVARELDIDIEQHELVLRLYESSDLVRYHNIPVKTMKGSCRLRLQPHNAYYISLGIIGNNRFIPILTSNTVMKKQ